MSDQDTAATGWRYKLGLIMFTVPFAMFALIPILVPMMVNSATQAAAIVGGTLVAGEIIWFASIPLLGLKGFKALKSRAFGYLALPKGPISPARHRVGLVLMIFSAVVQETVLMGMIIAYFTLDVETMTHGLWGFTIEQEAAIVTYWLLAGAAMLVASAYILGLPFFQKISEAIAGPTADDKV